MDKKYELENICYDVVMKQFFVNYMDEEESFAKYKVNLQGKNFITYMTDAEIKLSIRYSIELLEKMRSRFENGIDREVFRTWTKELESETSVFAQLNIKRRLIDESFDELVSAIKKCRRVGGAYDLFISYPRLVEGIYTVYDIIIENFDDEDLYATCVFFLLRVIMWMNCEEV